MNVWEHPPSLGWRCGRGGRSSRAVKKAAKQIAADKSRLTQIENKEAKSVLSALIGVYLRLNCLFQQPVRSLQFCCTGRLSVPGNRLVFIVWWALALPCAGLSWADSSANTRKPLGVYAHVDVGDAIGSYPGSASPSAAQLHYYLRSLYASLLADPAISGITLGAHWDQTQPSNAGDP